MLRLLVSFTFVRRIHGAGSGFIDLVDFAFIMEVLTWGGLILECPLMVRYLEDAPMRVWSSLDRRSLPMRSHSQT